MIQLSTRVGNLEAGMVQMDPDIPAWPMPRSSECPFDPPPQYKEVREAMMPRVRLWDGKTPWFISRFEDYRKILSDSRFSANDQDPRYPSVSSGALAARNYKPSFISMDDPEHDRYRRMLTSEFTIRRMAEMRGSIQEIVDRQIDEMLASSPPVEFVQAFSMQVPSLVICALLGVPYEDHEFFQQCAGTLVSSSVTPEEARAASDQVLAYLSEVVERRIHGPREGLLGRLAVERVATGELSVEEAAIIGRLLLLAGHDTTGSMISLGVLALLQNPRFWDELRVSEDRKVVAGAVEELLRFLTVVHWAPRRFALEDVKIGDQLIRAGEGVILATNLSNRDPLVFPNPDALDIHRDAHQHVGFGWGIHACLGQPLARLELEIVYGTITKRIPTLRSAVPLEEIKFKNNSINYSVLEMPVTW